MTPGSVTTRWVALFLGTRSFPTLHDFLVALTTTPDGLVFLFLGNAVGAFLAIVLFSITFVSFPLFSALPFVDRVLRAFKFPPERER